MTTDRLLDLVGVPGGPVAEASLFHLEVVEAGPLTPTFHRVVLTASNLHDLRYRAGQDLMLRIPQMDDRVLNRRYTIRDFDQARAAVTVDVSLHGAGPGTDWIRAARIGDRIDAIGPRGKITLREDADWHLFVADETGQPGALAMIEALAPRAVATALFEIDTPADERELARPRPGGSVFVGFTEWVGHNRVIRRSSSRRSPRSRRPPAGDMHTWLQRLELYAALARLWLSGVSERIRSRPRRIGGGVSPTPSTASRLARNDADRRGGSCGGTVGPPAS